MIWTKVNLLMHENLLKLREAFRIFFCIYLLRLLLGLFTKGFFGSNYLFLFESDMFDFIYYT